MAHGYDVLADAFDGCVEQTYICRNSVTQQSDLIHTSNEDWICLINSAVNSWVNVQVSTGLPIFQKPLKELLVPSPLTHGENGGDLCAKGYREIVPAFPVPQTEVSFIREEDIDTLAAQAREATEQRDLAAPATRSRGRLRGRPWSEPSVL